MDLRIGAFGGDGIDRTELPVHAWRSAERPLRHRFAGTDTVVIRDTLLDVATGKATGARVIAVATGPASVVELDAAGADVVLADLTDTHAVVDAVTRYRCTQACSPSAETACLTGPSNKAFDNDVTL